MIVVTGGAGFIGSNIVAALNDAGRTGVVVCDTLGTEGKWQNLRKRTLQDIVPPGELLGWLDRRQDIEAIIHMGANSSTLAVDGDEVIESNFRFSLRLLDWCTARGVRFIYASSAATYGDGGAGFDDEFSTAALRRLRPLNLYGFSKHAFDLWVARQIETGEPAPPAWAGVKFFNVYGPNEYHKGGMISVVKVKHDEIAAGGPARLFRSDRADIADGEQRRDFIWIDDVTAALQFLLTAPGIAGLFNLGTGVARSYADLACAVCAANGVAERIDYVDMPASLRGQYQSFTEAPMQRLRQAGFNHKFSSLEDGIKAYVETYLRQVDPYR